MDIGRHWASQKSNGGKDDIADDCAFLGLEKPESAEPDTCDVLPENWSALQVFLTCQTQWRIIAGMGGAFYQGLDYPALIGVIQLYCKRKKHKGMFAKVQLIERGALERINDK